MVGERHQIVFVFLTKTTHFDRPNSSQIEEDGISFFKIFGEEKIALLCQFVIQIVQISHTFPKTYRMF
jgi:hypothetical protein